MKTKRKEIDYHSASLVKDFCRIYNEMMVKCNTVVLSTMVQCCETYCTVISALVAAHYCACLGLHPVSGMCESFQ